MSRSIRALFLSLLMTAMAATAGAQMRGLGRVNGQVLDDAGKPVADVDVQTTAAGGTVIAAKTNAGGAFVLVGLGRGDWLVVLKKAGYPDKRIKMVIEKELATSNVVKITMPRS